MLRKQIRHASCELCLCVCVGLRLDKVSLCWCVCVHTSLYLCVHSNSCVGIYACMCAVQTTFPTVMPAGVCCCCIPVCTTDRDFHSQRPADGPYMCQPLQQITKSRMFQSHFVISSMRKKLSAICDSRKIPGRISLKPSWQIFETTAQEKVI